MQSHRLLAGLAIAVFAITGCSESPDRPRQQNTAAADSSSAPGDTPTNGPLAIAEPAVSESPAETAPTSAAAVEPADASPADSVPADTTATKTARAPIYTEDSNGRELIADALKKAKRDHTHVLIEWGGNWCGWCYKLHDVFHQHDLVRPIVHEEFELVLIDQGKNHDLMLEYGGTDRQYSFPHLTILDESGTVLTNQETGSLEDGPKHDPALVAGFLRQWAPEKLDAELLLVDALAKAAAEDKSVLLRAGTPYCGWCTVLSQFLQDHESDFATDYVDLKIDTMRMTHGDVVATRFQPQGAAGIPWFVILDPAGSTLATSIGPEGNVGYPYQPQEISHFLEMLKSTRKRLTDEQLSAIETDLIKYRESRQQK